MINRIKHGIVKSHLWMTFVDMHISFYTVKSLRYLAEKFDRHYVGYRGLHIFSKQQINQKSLFFAIRFSSLINLLKRRRSLLGDDYQRITGMYL